MAGFLDLVATWCDRCFGTTHTTPEGVCCSCNRPKPEELPADSCGRTVIR